MGILHSPGKSAKPQILPRNKITAEIIDSYFSETILGTIPKDLISTICSYSVSLQLPELKKGDFKPLSVISSGCGHFAFPVGLGIDFKTGDICVSDYNSHRCEVFSSDGRYRFSIGRSGSGQGEFSCPFGVSYNQESEIIVSDSSNTRIQVFDGKNGHFSRTWGSRGSADGQFNAPRGICVDEEDNVYIADQVNQNVQIFKPDGTFLRKIGSPKQFDNPNDVAISPAGEILVVECGQCPRVQIFDYYGNFLRKFGKSGSGPAEFNYPHGIVIDSNGDIVVADYRANRIQFFNARGEFSKEISNTNGLQRALGIAINKQGQVLVVDNSNERVQVYG